MTTRTRWAAALLLLALSLLLFTPPVADPDLWGHVRFGQDLLATGEVSRPDPYSYLSGGQEWVNHEWLAEAVYALLFGALGPPGLAAFNAAMALACVALVYARLIRRGLGPLPAAGVGLIVAFTLRPGVLNIRPQGFTYLLFLLVVLVIARADEGDLRWLFALPAITALWANLHGGVLAGVGLVAIWAPLHWLQERKAGGLRAYAPALALLGCLLALLLTPYGPRLIVFLARTIPAPRPEIREWQPLDPGGVWGLWYLAELALMVAAVLISRRPRRVTLLALSGVCAVLPFLSLRHTPLAALALPVLLADHLAGTWERVAGLRPVRAPGERLAARLPRWAAHAAALAMLAAAVVLAGWGASRLGRIEVWPAVSDYPVRAVAVLKSAGVRGNMATEFNWGEYVIWQLGPGIRVSVDGRRETVYTEEIYRENLSFMRGEEGWERLPDREETNLALVDRTRPVYDLMLGKPGWALVYEDALAAVFAREGSPEAGSIAAVIPPAVSEDGGGTAFP